MIKIRSRTNKVPRFVPISCTSFSPHDLKYGSKMSSKLDEIARKLNDLLMEEIVLGLIENVETSNRTSRWLEEASMVNLSVIFILGRDGDKKALLGEEICDEKVGQLLERETRERGDDKGKTKDRGAEEERREESEIERVSIRSSCCCAQSYLPYLQSAVSKSKSAWGSLRLQASKGETSKQL
ncbi:hypothetical protein R6Q59_022181 [Mikania micrantha]